METTPRKTARRRILVERGAQAYMVLMIILYLVLGTIVSLAVIVAPSIVKFTSSDLPVEEQFAAARELLFLDSRVVPVVLVMLLAFAIHALFFSQRIFGPLVRLKRVIRGWREERVWPASLHVRKRDFHNVLFAEVNGLAEGLGREFGAAREQVRLAAEEARALAERSAGQPEGEAARRIHEACRQALEPMERWRL